MEFLVPQFIEKKPKIVGPLTFTQFLYIGGAGLICFLLFFLAPGYIFFLSLFVLFPLGTALAFIKIGGTPLPLVIKNFFCFLFSPKIYLWRKKQTLPPQIKTKPTPQPLKPPSSFVPKINEKSQLRKLFNQIETKL